jgi:molybdopterin synthase sulfur carrier subunit
MPTVFLPQQLRDLTDGVKQLDIEAETLRQAIDSLEERFPGVKRRLCDDSGLLPGLQVSVDNLSTRKLSTKLLPSSEIHFLPAIGGG